MLRRLHRRGWPGARDLVEALRACARRGPRGARPRVAAAMISTADGRAAIQGRSVALGHPADRALLRELRTAADAILVGAATMAAERYARLLDADQRALRAVRGEPEHPLIATVSRRLDLSPDIPVLRTSRASPVHVFTESSRSAPRWAGTWRSTASRPAR